MLLLHIMDNHFDVARHYNPAFEAKRQVIIDTRKPTGDIEKLATEIKLKNALPTAEHATDLFLKEVIPAYQEQPTMSLSFSISFDGKEYKIPHYTDPQLGLRDGASASIKPGQLAKLQEVRFALAEPPVLEIKNPPVFFEKLSQLETLINDKPDFAWFTDPKSSPFANTKMRDVFIRIWYSATPADFQNPEAYLDRVISFIQNDPLAGYKDGVNMGQVASLGRDLIMKNEYLDPRFEAPYALSCNLIPEGTDKSVSGRLPNVIYSVDDKTAQGGKKTAYIHAVQMPAIKELDKKAYDGQKSNLDLLTRSQADDIKALQQSFPDVLKNLIGELPPQLFLIEDPEQFLLALSEEAKKVNPGLFNKHGYFAQMDKWQEIMSQQSDDKARFGLTDILSIERTTEQIHELKNKAEEIESRKKLFRKLYQLDKGLGGKHKEKTTTDTSPGEGEYEEELLEVSRPAIVSLTAACATLHKEGIRDIAVPIYTPLRWQDHVYKAGIEESERIHHNSNDGLVTMFNRVAHKVGGIEVIAVSDEDGFVHIKMKDDPTLLKSDTPILQDVITTVLGS